MVFLRCYFWNYKYVVKAAGLALTHSVCVFDPVGKTLEMTFIKIIKQTDQVCRRIFKTSTCDFELLKHIGWPSLTVPGYELTCIGTLVKAEISI